MSINDQIDETIRKIQGHVTADGRSLADDAVAAVAEIIEWLQYFSATSHDGHASELLDGTRAFVVESVAYISLGLGRAAISAIRGQIDLLIAYTYFCNHPDEWEQVERTGDGFRLKSAIYRYHEDTNLGCKARLSLVEKFDDFGLSAVYQILSAHIHGQTKFTIPKTDALAEVVAPIGFCNSIVEIQERVSVAISNFLVAVYAARWPELPSRPVIRVKNLLKDQQRVAFFAD